jgi:hypothetical protein
MWTFEVWTKELLTTWGINQITLSYRLELGTSNNVIYTWIDKENAKNIWMQSQRACKPMQGNHVTN